MKQFLIALAILSTTVSVNAKDLDLVCLFMNAPNSAYPFEVKSVLIIEDQCLGIPGEPTLPCVSKGFAAHVSDSNTGDFDLLDSKEFKLKKGKDGYRYQFLDLKNRKSYDCDINDEVGPQPGIGREN